MAWLLSWLVQGLAVALATRAAMRMFPRLSAATRYAIWWAAVLLVLLLPVMRGSTRAPRTEIVATPVATAEDVDTPAQNTPGIAVAVPPVTLPRLPDWVLAVAIGAWLGTAMIGLVQLAYSVSMVRRLKQSCRRLTTPRESQLPLWSNVRERRRGVRVRATDRLRTAAVLGLRRPIIAVPREVSATLTSDELDQVILHEYAHVQRFDDWSKLVQVAISAFVGWHPAVRLMLREIDLEREAACDDWVVSITGAPRAYARCLTKMAGFVFVAGPAAIPYATSTSHTTRRIERLLDAAASGQRRGPSRLAPLSALTAIAALVVVTLCTARAFPVAMEIEHVAIETAEMISAAASAAPTDAAARGGELKVMSASMMPLALPFSGIARLSASARLGLDSTSPSTSAATPALPATPFAVQEAMPAGAVEPADVPHAEATNTEPVHSVSHDAVYHDGAYHDGASHDRPHHDGFVLGPVTAADPTSFAQVATDESTVDKSWGAVAREATTRAMGVGARSVGSATRSATSLAASNVKSATATAANHVKSSSAKTARVLGRVTRKVLPF